MLDAELQRDLDLYKALKNLELNPDFKLLIQQEYLINTPAVLAGKLGLDINQDKDAQSRLIKQLQSVGEFSNFLNRIRFNGEASVIADQELSDIDYNEDTE